MPIVPTIQELNRRILSHMDEHGLRTIVIYLSDTRNDPTLRYDNLGDTFGDRAINLIQYCRDNRCMSQLIDLLKVNNPIVLSVQQPPPDPVWDEWATQRDGALAKADTPSPPPTWPDSPPAASPPPAGVPPPNAPSDSPRPDGLSPVELQQATIQANTLGVYGEIADLYARAWVLGNHGRFAEAIDCYQQAVAVSEKAGDLNAQINILFDLARTYTRLGNVRAAGMTAFQIGNLYATLGQLQQAWVSFGQAYNMFISIGDLASANSCWMRAMALGQNFPPW